MRKRWARVAAPTSTSSRPVAKGSSVPACPTLVFRGRLRRTWATTSCEVMPAGLGKRITPCSITGAGAYRADLGCFSSVYATKDSPPSGPWACCCKPLQLLGHFAPQRVHELVDRELGGEARRLAV